MESVYSGDRYETPPATKRNFWDRLLLGCRIPFYFRYSRYLYTIRRKVLEGGYGRSEWVKNSDTILGFLEACGARQRVTGMDNISKVDGPVVFVSNHMSTYETQILPGIIVPRKDVTFVVKESLLTHRLFGPIMRFQRPVAVKRENPRDDFRTVMEEGRKVLAEGRSLIIFPQSTRDRTFDPEQFNSLGAKLAARAGVPIIPVALKTDFWDNGRLIKDFGPLIKKRRVYFEFGEPFMVTGNGKEAQQRVLNFITTRLKKWGAPIRKGS